LISLIVCLAAMLFAGCAGAPPHSLDLMPAPAAYGQAATPFGHTDAGFRPANR
jgi:uncharacterized lipoprotein YajG